MKRCLLFFYEDDAGCSFVALDADTRTVYEDVIEKKNLPRLVDALSVRETITNMESCEGLLGHVRSVSLDVPPDHSHVHTSSRALRFASMYVGQTIHSSLDLSRVRRQPFRFEEEWVGWLAPRFDDALSEDSVSLAE
jgi:hypothetical protein